MKYLLMLILLSATSSLLLAQTYRVQQCVIENGVLKSVSADYDPSTGNYSLTVDDIRKSFNEVYPEKGNQYAATATWYVNNEKIIMNEKTYVKYGLPRVLGTTEIKKTTVYNRIGVYVEAGTEGIGEVIYIPVRRGCEFQPYQVEVSKPIQKKIYYDENWKVSLQSNASYYRLAMVNADGKPAGMVKDFYINGTKQWQGYFSHMDPKDNTKDIMDGVCAWFHPNGTKSSEVYYVQGKENGVYKSWGQDGSLEQEIEYKHGVIHGYVKSYYNGQLVSTEYYDNGKKR